MRDQLKTGLSGTTPEPGNQSGPSVSDLAEKIKTLKAAHTIEAMPQRVRQKQSSAEEPVTARIRRRTEAILAPHPAIQPDGAASPTVTSTPPGTTGQISSTNAPMTFQERVARERHPQNLSPTLSWIDYERE